MTRIATHGYRINEAAGFNFRAAGRGQAVDLLAPVLRVALASLLCLAALLGASGAALAAAPQVKAISPNNGPEAGGTSVTITGSGFVSGTTVKFGANAATGVSGSETSIKATSPQGKGLVGISVTNSNGTSASTPYDQFAYDAPPSRLWLGLNNNTVKYLGQVNVFALHGIVYDRSFELTAGQVPSELEHGNEAEEFENRLKEDYEDGMIPVGPVEYKGYDRPGYSYASDPEFPQKRTKKEEEEGKNTIKGYVEGFIKSASAVVKLVNEKYPGMPVLLEPMNEPWGNTTPQYNGAEYANVIAELLPEAQRAGIPLSDIYVGATGKKWVSEMYEGQAKLETEIQGWYLHPYGPPSGSYDENGEGIQSLPYVQAEMTSGQNNIIVSEVGYCAIDVEEGKSCPSEDAESSATAAASLTEMLKNATVYHEEGWLKGLMVYSRNAYGWAMQVPYEFMTAQASAYVSYADAEKLPGYSSHFGSTGSGEGQFEEPWGTAVDPRTGNVYVSDYSADRVEEFSPSGVFVAWVGSFGHGEGQLDDPEGLAVDSAGDLYVGDYGNHRVEEFNSAHEYVRKFGTEGKENGEFAGEIGGLAIDSSGNVWVVDTGNNRVQEFSATGGYLNKVGSEGSENGEFKVPRGIAFDNGNLYVTDYSNHRVQEFSTAGAYIRQWGSWGNGDGQLEDPWGIASDPRTGNLFVTDFSSDRMEEFSSTGTFIAWLGESGAGNGQFEDPEGIATNATGGVYVVDSFLDRIDVWASGGPSWEGVTSTNPTGATASQMSSVYCTTGCTAVGSYTSKAGVKEAFGESWEGAEWVLQSVPSQKGTKASVLSGVSCSTSSVCTAVGSGTETSGTAVTLAEGWNGKEWAVQSTPNPSQAKASVLVGVACPTKACTAVGYSTTKLGVKEPLAEGWEGTKWSQQSAAVPKGAKASSLGGVSCSSSSACTAVGVYTNSSATEVALAEGWNGKEWAVQGALNPSQAKASVLMAVSCPTKACEAVGSYASSSKVTEPFAESYNGSEWSLQSVPLPNGAKGGELSSVSCVTVSACTAVGSYTSKEGARETLALGWNGTLWSLQSTPNPSKGKGDTLAGVSCVWITGCYSVGSYTNSSSTLVTLGQKYFG
jgi:hypothetical protein